MKFFSFLLAAILPALAFGTALAENGEPAVTNGVSTLKPQEIFHGSIPDNTKTPAQEILGNDQGGPSVKGYVTNKCSFPIWVGHDCCEKNCPPLNPVRINPGQRYETPTSAIANECSQTIHMYWSPSDVGKRNEYLVEYNIDKYGLLWYNLSHESGNPFTSVSRFLNMGDQCRYFWCPPGNDLYWHMFCVENGSIPWNAMVYQS